MPMWHGKKTLELDPAIIILCYTPKSLAWPEFCHNAHFPLLPGGHAQETICLPAKYRTDRGVPCSCSMV